MYEAIVIGASAGGLEALKEILPKLPADFLLPIVIVQHTTPDTESYLAECLNRLSALTVKEAEDKETMRAGTAYIAPPAYHLLIESDRSFSLSVDPRVHFSCPSIDVLFESAVDAFRENLIGIILTGANADGSRGLQTIKKQGGLTVVQNPETAYISYMPQSAIRAVEPDYIVNVEEIAALLQQICNPSERDRHGAATSR